MSLMLVLTGVAMSSVLLSFVSVIHIITSFIQASRRDIAVIHAKIKAQPMSLNYIAKRDCAHSK